MAVLTISIDLTKNEFPNPRSGVGTEKSKLKKTD